MLYHSGYHRNNCDPGASHKEGKHPLLCARPQLLVNDAFVHIIIEAIATYSTTLGTCNLMTICGPCYNESLLDDF